MASFNIIVSIPFTFLAVRSFFVRYFHLPSDLKQYTQLALDVTTIVLCGFPLLYITWSQIFSLTPFVEPLLPLQYLGIQIFALIYEYHRTPHLKDVFILAFLLSMVWYFRDDFVQDVLLDVLMKLGVLRSIVSLLEFAYFGFYSTAETEEEVRWVLRKAFWKLEAAILIYSCFRRVWVKDTMEESVILSLLAIVFLYSGTIQRYNIIALDMIDRSAKKPEIMTVIPIPLTRVEQEQLVIYHHRNRQFVALNDEEVVVKKKKKKLNNIKQK
jgi:hypothetical protein